MYKVILEHARDGNLTCKVELNKGFKYVYSKYRPLDIKIDDAINQTAKYILLLGFGLGYEYEYYRNFTDKCVLVVEGHETFKKHAQEKGINLLLLEDAKDLVNKHNVHIIYNKNVIECFPQYYEQFLPAKLEAFSKEKIIVFDYPVIAKDCAAAFEKCGLDVEYITEETFESFIHSLKKSKPKFMFGINFQTHLADLAEQWEIPYVYWVVDTPSYNLYYEKNKDRSFSIGFIYDRSIVKDLKRKGFSRVFYMPVAANVERLNKIILNDDDRVKYNCDVSFLGNTCVQNEFTQYIEPKIDDHSKNLIDRLIDAQMFKERFIIKDVITNEIAEAFFDVSGIIFKKEKFRQNFEMKDSLNFFLGRYHSYVERAKIANLLSDYYKLHVYGDSEWLNVLKQSNIYRGNAEHFTEMPKVFKASKINLNIIRSFVDSGLPMRVFDILGSAGFLLTNNKQDIAEYFIDGKDLVVYRDEKDLIEITKYYLENEDQRAAIALNGFQKVNAKHTYEIRLKNILKVLSEIL